MNGKKVVVIFAVLAVVAAIIALSLTFFYFKYWRKPAAEYVKTDNPKLIQIRKDLTGLKADLKRQGIYECCIENDCNWCAIYMGHCPCAELVTEEGNEKSCPECAAAWNRKQGRIPGVDPDAIKVTTFGVYGFKEGGNHHPEFEHQEEKRSH